MYKEKNIRKKREIFLLAILILTVFLSTIPRASAITTLALHTDGMYLKDSSGNIIHLHGINLNYHIEDTSFGLIGGKGPGYWDASFIDRVMGWLQSQSMNFARFHLRADFVYHNTGNINQHISDICTIAATHGIYCLFDIYAIGTDPVFINGNPIPYSPYLTENNLIECPSDAIWNAHLVALANDLKTHNNALLEIVNEPYLRDSTAVYNAYWAGIPVSIKAIRNTGFTGIVAVMADIGWAPNYLPGITDLGWAIDNLAIFTTPGTYGSVVADFHAFYDYIAPYNPADFPTSYSSMASTWLGTGRIQEAQNDGIAIISTECGSKGSSAAKTGFTNQLTFYNAHYISYTGWIFLVRDTEGFSLISSLRWQSTTVAVWSTTGRILHQACLSAPQPKLRR